MSSLAPIIAELERLYGEFLGAFDYFAEDVEAMRANPPIIAIASRGRKRTVRGWYVPSVWEDVTSDLLDALVGDPGGTVQTKRAEIVLASETLREPALTIAVEVTRGMLSHAMSLRGIRSRRGASAVPGESNYYPEAWTSIAKQVGLVAKSNPEQPSKGWSMLEPTPAFVSTVTPLLRESVFDLSRDAMSDRPAVGSRMLKYRCGCTTIRSATYVNAKCGTCKEVFRWAERFEPPAAFVAMETRDGTREAIIYRPTTK